MQHNYELPSTPLPAAMHAQRFSIPYLHIFLFLATILSTTHVGALQYYPNVLDALRNLSAGLSFSLPLLLILLSHELGHYVVSRRRGIRVTLPYFLPMPVVSIIGTMGAFIKIQSLVPDRRSLFDVGVSGPLVGFAVALPVSLVGLSLSRVVPVAHLSGGLQLGDSLLFLWMQRLVLNVDPSVSTVLLHPMAFAGWVGLLVTALNLIPAGQLDGGHIAFALLGPLHKRFSSAVVALLIVLGFLTWYGWIFWAVIISLTMSRFKHSPVYNSLDRLDVKRRWLAAVTMLIFVTTFTPVPFKVL